MLLRTLFNRFGYKEGEDGFSPGFPTISPEKAIIDTLEITNNLGMKLEIVPLNNGVLEITNKSTRKANSKYEINEKFFVYDPNAYIQIWYGEMYGSRRDTYKLRIGISDDEHVTANPKYYRYYISPEDIERIHIIVLNPKESQKPTTSNFLAEVDDKMTGNFELGLDNL